MDTSRTKELEANLRVCEAGLRATQPRNVVCDLTAAGLLMCADTGPGRALYEATDTWHHHIVCRVCGVVIDIPCERGERPCLEPPETFRGTCEQCSDQARSTPQPEL